LALFLAAAITIYAMARAAGGGLDLGTVAFMAWGISPYVLLAIVALLLSKFASPSRLWTVTLVVGILMLVATIFAYIVSMNGQSSTEALVFVFVPLYLMVGGIVTLALGLGLSWLVKRKTT